jgi:peptidoglycan hydrolase-like protein with peptidoglycan-binding domain
VLDLVPFDPDPVARRRIDIMSALPGPVDGVLGHQTQAAVGDFQRSIPVQPTGIIDDDLIAQLLS